MRYEIGSAIHRRAGRPGRLHGPRAGEIGWPEAVARLTKERSNAEVCVASLKGRGNSEQVSRGRLTYGAAKADLDAVIAGLMTALAEGGNPESLPSLEAELERGAAALAAFCKTVSDVPLSTAEQKNRVGEAVKDAMQPFVGGRLDDLHELPAR